MPFCIPHIIVWFRSQICPFPYDLITQQLELYPKAELLWAQEEHKNSGAWSYVQPRFDTALLQNEKETLVPIWVIGLGYLI